MCSELVDAELGAKNLLLTHLPVHFIPMQTEKFWLGGRTLVQSENLNSASFSLFWDSLNTMRTQSGRKRAESFLTGWIDEFVFLLLKRWSN